MKFPKQVFVGHAAALLLAAAWLVFASCAWAQTNSLAQPAPGRFEQQVRVYQAADKSNAPPTGAILLAGDSQFFRWKTFREDFPGFTIINRGIDGYETSDLLHDADRIVLPYKPRLIVLNVGGNDVHTGKTTDVILQNLKSFVAKVHASLPGVPIVVCGISPGPTRWPEADRRVEANRAIQEYVSTQPGLTFVDVWQPMLTAEGKPRTDIWMDDGIHSNHAGYLIRAKLMLPTFGQPKEH